MKFSTVSNLDLEDTLVSDIFILKYMDKLELIDFKVYMYILYFSKFKLNVENRELASKLNITEDELSYSLDRLCVNELIMKNIDGYTIINLKEIEIQKNYTPMLNEEIENEESEIEKRRADIAEAINEAFFNGVMPYAWYKDIGEILDKFQFDDDILIPLFQYCAERNALNKKYVYAVSETWFKNKVKTFDDLELYLEKVAKMQVVVSKIAKALGLNRELTKYEKQYIDKWVNEYNYEFNIIEEALKKTVTKTNPSISYVNGILKNWFEKGYKTVEDIQNEEKKVVPSTKIKDKNDSIKFKNLSTSDFENLESFYDIM